MKTTVEIGLTNWVHFWNGTSEKIRCRKWYLRYLRTYIPWPQKKTGKHTEFPRIKNKIPAVFFKPTRAVLRSQRTKRTNYWRQWCMLPRCSSLARTNFPKTRSPGKGTHSNQFRSLLLLQRSLAQRLLAQRSLGHAALVRGEGGGARSINQRSFWGLPPSTSE